MHYSDSDWQVSARKDRRRNAYVAVRYRSWWFYIADDDQSAKGTFSLLHILFELQSATARGVSPLRTLPVGN